MPGLPAPFPGAVTFDLGPTDVLTIGLLGAVALAGGMAVKRWLPISEVVTFLVIGVLLGPRMLGVIDHDAVETLRPVTAVALAAMVFLIGERLRLSRLRRMSATVIPMAVLGSAVSFAAVFGAVIAAGGSPSVAYLLAALSPATAPVTVRALIAEQRAAGPFTEHLLAGTAVNNVCAALLFGIGAPFVLANLSEGSAAATAGISLLQVLGASFVCGYVGGRALAELSRRIESREQQFLLVWVMLLVVVGVSRYLNASVVIAALVMGAVAANSRGTPDSVYGHVRILEPPIFLVFFLVTGADAHLARFADLGIIGGAFIGARVAGRLVGGLLGSRTTRAGREARHVAWGAAAQLPLAGMAVGLASYVVSTTESVGAAEVGENVAALVLGTVLIFELVTPLIVHRALVVAGEQGAEAPDAPHEEPGLPPTERPSERREEDALLG